MTCSSIVWRQKVPSIYKDSPWKWNASSEEDIFALSGSCITRNWWPSSDLFNELSVWRVPTENTPSGRTYSNRHEDWRSTSVVNCVIAENFAIFFHSHYNTFPIFPLLPDFYTITYMQYIGVASIFRSCIPIPRPIPCPSSLWPPSMFFPQFIENVSAQVRVGLYAARLQYEHRLVFS